jgi:hypothetical protein
MADRDAADQALAQQDAAPLGPSADDEEYFDDSEDEWANPPVDSNRPPPATDRIHDSDEDERSLAGEAVPITFKLPDGSVVERSYRMGHTIALIKAHLEDYHHLPYDKTTLKLNGTVCIDPLSLNDLPFKANEENIVDVELAN